MRGCGSAGCGGAGVRGCGDGCGGASGGDEFSGITSKRTGTALPVKYFYRRPLTFGVRRIGRTFVILPCILYLVCRYGQLSPGTRARRFARRASFVRIRRSRTPSIPPPRQRHHDAPPPPRLAPPPRPRRGPRRRVGAGARARRLAAQSRRPARHPPRARRRCVVGHRRRGVARDWVLAAVRRRRETAVVLRRELRVHDQDGAVHGRPRARDLAEHHADALATEKVRAQRARRRTHRVISYSSARS